jgi:hypothetical protein
MTEPIPVGGQYGAADWQDYVNNWRDADATWLQSRSILRFANNTDRDAVYTSVPPAGQFIFNAADVASGGGLEMSNGTLWLGYKAMPVNLVKTADDSGQVSISHSGAAGKGIQFTPTYVGTNADLRVQGGVLTVDTTGVSVKTGAATAKLTTDATQLLIDKPVSIPSLTLTGAGTVFSAPGKTIAVGIVTATTATITNITLGGTLTGGVLNGSSGTIGGVAMASNRATAASGFLSQNGLFYGGSTAAVMRYRDPSDGSLGTSYVQVTDVLTQMVAPNIYLDGDVRIRTGATIYWYNTAGAFKAYGGLVVYSTTDPGAANYPPGTLWIS